MQVVSGEVICAATRSFSGDGIEWLNEMIVMNTLFFAA
jgi:hypothetical protein